GAEGVRRQRQGGGAGRQPALEAPASLAAEPEGRPPAGRAADRGQQGAALQREAEATDAHPDRSRRRRARARRHQVRNPIPVADEAPVTATATKTPPRMLQKYRDKAVPALQKEFGYGNPMMVPRLLKVVVNMGVGQAVNNKARIEAAVKDLTAIVGQK